MAVELCGVCGQKAKDAPRACFDCGARYHEPCFGYGPECVLLGCAEGAPAPESWDRVLGTMTLAARLRNLAVLAVYATVVVAGAVLVRPALLATLRWVVGGAGGLALLLVITAWLVERAAGDTRSALRALRPGGDPRRIRWLGERFGTRLPQRAGRWAVAVALLAVAARVALDAHEKGGLKVLARQDPAALAGTYGMILVVALVAAYPVLALAAWLVRGQEIRLNQVRASIALKERTGLDPTTM
jgi:hypothetical protein